MEHNEYSRTRRSARRATWFAFSAMTIDNAFFASLVHGLAVAIFYQGPFRLMLASASMPFREGMLRLSDSNQVTPELCGVPEDCPRQCVLAREPSLTMDKLGRSLPRRRIARRVEPNMATDNQASIPHICNFNLQFSIARFPNIQCSILNFEFSISNLQISIPS